MAPGHNMRCDKKRSPNGLPLSVSSFTNDCPEGAAHTPASYIQIRARAKSIALTRDNISHKQDLI